MNIWQSHIWEVAMKFNSFDIWEIWEIQNIKEMAQTCLLDDSDFFFWFFHFSENESKPNGPPNPKDERLMVAAFATKGLKWRATDSGSGFSFVMESLPESGTAPFWPWKSRNAMSKLGPSSKIGPFPPRTWFRCHSNHEKDFTSI